MCTNRDITYFQRGQTGPKNGGVKTNYGQNVTKLATSTNRGVNTVTRVQTSTQGSKTRSSTVQGHFNGSHVTLSIPAQLMAGKWHDFHALVGEDVQWGSTPRYKWPTAGWDHVGEAGSHGVPNGRGRRCSMV